MALHPLYIQQWQQVQGNETWTLSLQRNGYVVLEGGPHLFEEAVDCTWQAFIDGELDALVLRYLTPAILTQAKQAAAQAAG